LGGATAESTGGDKRTFRATCNTERRSSTLESKGNDTEPVRHMKKEAL
jgi:hypothetical protein